MVVALNTENWTSNPIHCPSTAPVCVSESFDIQKSTFNEGYEQQDRLSLTVHEDKSFLFSN